jgi:hypothetical protein
MLRSILCVLTIFALAFASGSLVAGEGAKKEQAEAKAEKQVEGQAKKDDVKKADGDKKADIKQDKVEKKPKTDKQLAAEKAKKADKANKAAKAKKPKAAAGVVKSLDAAAKTITITKTNRKEKTSEDVTFSIDDNATVVIRGEVKALADVVTGKRAKLMLSPDGQKVIAIEMGKKKQEKKPAA